MKRAAFLSLLTLLLTLTAYAQGEKVKLAVKAKAGQVARYRMSGQISLDAGGQKLAFEIKETEKVTFTAVAADGNVTVERVSEDRELTVDGMKVPAPDSKDEKSTQVVRPDGTLVSYSSTSNEKDDAATAVRMIAASSPIFSAQPVGVGDKWQHEYKSDPTTKQVAGKADFELLALEKSPNGADSARVKLSFTETEGVKKLSSRGTLWVERSSGDVVSSDLEMDNLPFDTGAGDASASGKIHQERISGSPLGDGPMLTSSGTGTTKPEPAKPKTIDEVVKDYTKESGLFTLYRKKETSGRETLYLELREDQLNQLLMLQATAATGNAEAVIAGDPLMDQVFSFRLMPDDRVFMVAPRINFRAAPNSPIARSVERGFPDGYLEAFKIEARQAERKSLLINISDYFRGDPAQVGPTLSSGGMLGLGGGGGSYSLDRDKTILASVRMFPANLCVQTAYHFTRGGQRSPFGGPTNLADPRSLPLKVEFNLFALRSEGYRPRLADPRVGYFYTEYRDFTEDGRDSQMVRYIIRWDIEKADPSAALSPPKKPIVFWIDNAMPLEYRDAAREGILMWNKAFEKAGIKDAIQVKQMPDDADWTIGDMRYNTIRWSTTEDPPYGAISLFRVNPLTGEIVNASITVDAILARSTKLERRRLVEPASKFELLEKMESGAARSLHPCRCELGAGIQDQAWFGLTAMQLTGATGIDEKGYVHSFLRSIVGHEMGHTLGLFHNFIASTQLSLTDLKDPAKIKERGLVGSLMEYFPYNISALKLKNVDYWPSAAGPYDKWAIEYGYSPAVGTRPEDELIKLRQIASQGNVPGHAFQNDQLADQWDPHITRFDLASDPLEYHTRLIEVTAFLIKSLGQREPRRGESYWDFTRTLNGLMSQYSSAAAQISRYIGGIHANHNHKGDAGEQPTRVPVSGEKQRKALQLLNTYLFSESSLRLPKSYFTQLSDNPFPEQSSFIGGVSADFPMLDTLSNLQRSGLRRIFSSGVLNRVANNEFKSEDADQMFSLVNLYQNTGANIWSELEGGRSISALRRRLQRAHLETMIGQAIGTTAVPEDARALAWDQLRRIRSRITSGLTRKPDEMTRVHLEESLTRINRALNTVQTIGGAPAPAPNPLAALLGLGNENRR